jgi:hypothetical protein
LLLLTSPLLLSLHERPSSSIMVQSRRGPLTGCQSWGLCSSRQRLGPC